MYFVWMVNFQYYLQGSWKTFEEANGAGKATGFEYTVKGPENV